MPTTDGEPDTSRSGEQWRHECEVREWLRRRAGKSSDWLRERLDSIEKRRGKQAADRLRAGILKAWNEQKPEAAKTVRPSREHAIQHEHVSSAGETPSLWANGHE